MLTRSRALLAIVAICLPPAVLTTAPSQASAASASAPQPAGWFHPLSQQVALNATEGAVAKSITVAGKFGASASVRAVEVLVTARAATQATTLSMYPTGAARPARPVLTVAKGGAEQSSVTVPVASNGKISVANAAGRVHETIALLGWYGAASSARSAADAGYVAGPGHAAVSAVTVQPGHPRVFAMTGRAGIPTSSVTAVHAQVMASAGKKAAALRLFGASAAQPSAPTVTVARHKTSALALSLPLGTGANAGKIRAVATGGPVVVTVNALGWFSTAASAAQVITSAPMRNLATKTVAAGETVSLAVLGHAGVPATNVSAVAISITALAPHQDSRLTAFGGSMTRPLTPTVVAAKGTSPSAETIVPVGSDGTFKVYNRTGTVRAALTVDGWFSTAAATTPPAETGPDAATLATLTQSAGAPSPYAEPVSTGRTETYTTDAQRAVTATIGAAGGTITVHPADGSTLTLSIPAQALLADTTITATPVLTMSGTSDVGATPYGLQLEPAGLVLLQPAVLTVTPNGGVQARQAIGAEAADDGSLTRPSGLLPDASTFSLPVLHFSLHVILVSNGDGGFVAQYFADGDYTANVQSRITKVLEDARQAALDNNDYDLYAHLQPLWDEYYNEIVAPIITRSAGDCDYAEANWATALSYERSRDILGATNPTQSAAILNGTVANLQNCWKQRTAACMTMDPKQWGDVLTIARQMLLLGVKTASGIEPNPSDPNQVHWCGNANGYVDVTYSSVSDWGYSKSNETNTYRYWISAQYFTEPRTGGGYNVSMIDKGSVLDLTYQKRIDTTYNETCLRTSKADLSLVHAPAPISVAQEFPTDTITTDIGFYGTSQRRTTPLTIADNCHPVPPETAYVQSDICTFKHTEHLDRVNNNFELSGTRDSNESGYTVRRTISGSIHLDNLSAALPPLQP